MKHKNVQVGMPVILKNLPSKTSQYEGQKGTVLSLHAFEPTFWIIVLELGEQVLLSADNLKRVKS